MLRRAPLLAILPLLATACGGTEPTQEQIDEARARVEQAASAMARARTALEILGVLPVYTCGEPRRTFVGSASESVHVQFACVTATTEPVDASTDAVVLAFAEAGCSVEGHGLSGQGRFLYSGGEDRMALTADLRELKVDGHPLQAKVGYGTCGDESSAWVNAAGTLPGQDGHTFHVDGRVASRPGAPIIGGSELRLGGTGSLSGPEGTDRLTLTDVVYEDGEYLPKEGEVLVETADGGRVKATFRAGLWRTGKVELVIDDAEPVTVPIVR
jgi:hypothetical protein